MELHTFQPNASNASWSNITVPETNVMYTIAYVTILSWKILPPILIVFGTIGNIMTLLLLRRKEVDHMPATPYLNTLACVDIVVLHTGLLRKWIMHVFKYDIRTFSSAACKVHTFSVYMSIHLSVWLVVAVTVERFVCVRFPFRSIFIEFKHRMIVITGIFLFFFLLNFHFLIGRLLVTYRGVTLCSTLYKDYFIFLKITWKWIDFSVFCFIPFGIIVVCNLAIIYTVYKSRKNGKIRRSDTQSSSTTRRLTQIGSCDDEQEFVVSADSGNTSRNNTRKTDKQNRSEYNFNSRESLGNSQMVTLNQSTGGQVSKKSKVKATNSMTVLLLTLNSVLLITTGPVSIFLIYASHWPNRRDPEQSAYIALGYMIVMMLSYLNNCVNFLLYCLTGPRFRNALRGLLRLNRNQ